MPNRTRTDPRTPAERAAIAEGRRRAWRVAKTLDASIAELAARLFLYERGIKNDLEAGACAALFQRAAQAPDLDPGRVRSLQMYAAALLAGRRIARKTYSFAPDGGDDGGEGIIPALLVRIAACI